MSWQAQRQLEKEEERIETAFESGHLSQDEYNYEMRELRRDYNAAAEWAIYDAAEQERNDWYY